MLPKSDDAKRMFFELFSQAEFFIDTGKMSVIVYAWRWQISKAKDNWAIPWLKKNNDKQ